MPASKNQIVWSNENYINCYDFILSLLIPCSVRHAPYICFCCIFIAFFSHFKWMLINSDLLRTNEWIDSIESITRLIQWICLMRYILSLTIFSFTNNTVAIHAKQCCLTINLSADRIKKKWIYMPTNRWTRRNNSTIKIDSFERNHWEFERIKETNYRAMQTNSSRTYFQIEKYEGKNM